MGESVLIGRAREIIEVTWPEWEQGLAGRIPFIQARLGFMSPDHHLVRNFAVRELPRRGSPMPPEFISGRLGLPLERVVSIIAELEKNLTFLVRNEKGEVVWAYPVTVDKTPHQATFSTGETLHAAWAIDAIATPFVQGRLRNAPLAVTIRTECGHCAERIEIELTPKLGFKILQGPREPLVFLPFVDFGSLRDPSIIDAFWRKSVFFWSEEHAKDYRTQSDQIEGAYYTLGQSAYHVRLLQSALFAFS